MFVIGVLRSILKLVYILLRGLQSIISIKLVGLNNLRICNVIFLG